MILVIIDEALCSITLQISIRIVSVVFVHPSCLTRVLVEEIRCVVCTYCVGGVCFAVSCFVVCVGFDILVDATRARWSCGNETFEIVVGVRLGSVSRDE